MGHYEVLGVPRDASAAEVRRAYLEQARRHHPDRAGGSHERMRLLNEAWATLGDPEQRRSYDRSLAVPPRSRPAPAGTWQASPAGGAVRPPEPLDDLLDDRPVNGGVVRLPGWVALVPPGMLAAALLTFVFGLLMNIAGIMALGGVLGFVAVLLFATSPLVALLASRR